MSKLDPEMLRELANGLDKHWGGNIGKALHKMADDIERENASPPTPPTLTDETGRYVREPAIGTTYFLVGFSGIFRSEWFAEGECHERFSQGLCYDTAEHAEAAHDACIAEQATRIRKAGGHV